MELKISLGYEQVLEMVKQLPANQLVRLIQDSKKILEKEKKVPQTSFQDFLLSAPTMSDEQHDAFLENRKNFEFLKELKV